MCVIREICGFGSLSVIKQIMALDPKIRQYDVERGEILRMLVSFKGTWMKARTLLHALDDIRRLAQPRGPGLPPQLPGRRRLRGSCGDGAMSPAGAADRPRAHATRLADDIVRRAADQPRLVAL